MAADAATPPAGWKEYSPKDKSFSVWLPEKSNRRSERERTMSIRGQRVKVNLVQVEIRGGLTYGASTLLMNARLTRAIPQQQRLEIFRDAFLNEVKGKVSQEQDIKEGLATGKEYTIETGQGSARLRVFARGGRLYRASVMGGKAQVDSKEADTFLESFKLSAKAPETTAETPPATPADKDKGKGTADSSGLKWLADASKMTVPDAPAAGKLLGADFKIDKAHFNGIGVLTLQQGNGDAEVLIFMNVKRDEKLDDKSYMYNVKAPGQRAPHIHVRQKDMRNAYVVGYAMLLEFGKEKDGMVPAKIYLCLPDKSVIAGTFSVKR